MSPRYMIILLILIACTKSSDVLAEDSHLWEMIDERGFRTEMDDTDESWRRIVFPETRQVKFDDSEPGSNQMSVKSLQDNGVRSQRLEQQRQAELIQVELDETSELSALPGETATIRLKFVNQRNLDIALYVTVGDTRNFVTAGVRRIYIGQQQVENLAIAVNVPQETTIGTTDIITINSQESQYFEGINATIYFYVTYKTVDTTEPTISHRIVRNCEGAMEPGTCSYKNWTFETTIQDKDSGIRKITTQPVKLITNNQLIIGSRNPVILQCSVSCCNNEVEIKATDLYGNTRSYKIDVNGLSLGAGEIAAIVLAVILIIILIIALIAVCVRQRKKSHSFPSSSH